MKPITAETTLGDLHTELVSIGASMSAELLSLPVAAGEDRFRVTLSTNVEDEVVIARGFMLHEAVGEALALLRSRIASRILDELSRYRLRQTDNGCEILEWLTKEKAQNGSGHALSHWAYVATTRVGEHVQQLDVGHQSIVNRIRALESQATPDTANDTARNESKPS